VTILLWVGVAAVVVWAAFLLLSIVAAVVRIACAAERLADCAEAQNVYYGLRPDPDAEGVFPADGESWP
jgi:hypothetical protein